MMDTDELNRAKDRNEIDAPKSKKSSTDIDEPKRAQDRKDNDAPNTVKSKTDS